MEEIKNWLESEEKDYQQGILLLTKYGRNRVLANILSRKQNNANQQKLTYELGKIAGRPFTPEEVIKLLPAVELKVVADVGTTGKKIEIALGSVSDTAEKMLDDLVAEMQKLYTDSALLSNTLADQTSDEARAKVASDILGMKDRYNSLAETKRYFEENGKFPPAPAAAPAPDASNDKGELFKVRNNLRSQRTKAQAAVDKKPGDVAKQEKLAKIQVELNNVEAKIKILG